jgi:surfactin synthase thioesterase subunit
MDASMRLFAQERLGRAPAWIGASGCHAPQPENAHRYQLHQLSDGALASTLAKLGSDPLADSIIEDVARSLRHALSPV